MNAAKVLIVLALVCFVLAAFGVTGGIHLALMPLGLAFLAASKLC